MYSWTTTQQYSTATGGGVRRRDVRRPAGAACSVRRPAAGAVAACGAAVACSSVRRGRGVQRRGRGAGAAAATATGEAVSRQGQGAKPVTGRRTVTDGRRRAACGSRRGSLQGPRRQPGRRLLQAVSRAGAGAAQLQPAGRRPPFHAEARGSRRLRAAAAAVRHPARRRLPDLQIPDKHISTLRTRTSSIISKISSVEKLISKLTITLMDRTYWMQLI
nr:E3 ubiquitin-protein ligase ZFP91 [Oryza sativa Japonica Group]